MERMEPEAPRRSRSLRRFPCAVPRPAAAIHIHCARRGRPSALPPRPWRRTLMALRRRGRYIHMGGVGCAVTVAVRRAVHRARPGPRFALAVPVREDCPQRSRVACAVRRTRHRLKTPAGRCRVLCLGARSQVGRGPMLAKTQERKRSFACVRPDDHSLLIRF